MQISENTLSRIENDYSNLNTNLNTNLTNLNTSLTSLNSNITNLNNLQTIDPSFALSTKTAQRLIPRSQPLFAIEELDEEQKNNL